MSLTVTCQDCRALAYRDSSAVVMHKHHQQARAVLDALSNAGFAVVKMPARELDPPLLADAVSEVETEELL